MKTASKIKEECPYCGEIAYFVDEFKRNPSDRYSPIFRAYECCECYRYHERAFKSGEIRASSINNDDYPIDVVEYMENEAFAYNDMI